MSHTGLIFAIVLLDSLGIALIALGIALAHNEVIAPERALSLSGVGGLVMLLSIGVVHLLIMRKAGLVAALIMGAATLAILGAVVMQTPLFKLPRINDISTDLEIPPPLSVAMPGDKLIDPQLPQDFIPHIKQHYADLKPLLTPKPAPDVLKKAAEAIKALPGVAEVRVDEARGLVHAVEITPLMRFRDDFVVRVRPEAAGSRVDARSRSRVGKSDLGANAARIRRVLAAVDRAAR